MNSRIAPARRRAMSSMLAAGLALGLGAVAGACASTTSTTDGHAKVTLVEEDYYGAPTPTSTAPTYLDSFFAKYHREHPWVTIKRESPVTPNYVTLVLSQIAAHQQPDLLMTDNPYLDQLASYGVLEPLRSLGSISTAGYNPGNVVETTYNGKLYGMPLYTNTIAIFYNKTILAKGGIKTLPHTWAQFAADAKKLSSPSHYGFVFSGQTGPGQATWQFEPWLWSNGGSLTDLTAKPAEQALSYLAGLTRSGAAPKAVVNWGQSQPMEEFEAGKAAFCENGSWNIPTLQSQFKKLKWGVIEIPTRRPGQPVVPPFGGEVWTVPKTTPVKERAAFALLQAMSKTNNLKPLAEGLSDIPTQTSQWGRKPWNGPEYTPFYAELRHGRSRTLPPFTTQYPTVDTDVGNAIQSALLGQKTPAAALAQAASQVKGLVG